MFPLPRSCSLIDLFVFVWPVELSERSPPLAFPTFFGDCRVFFSAGHGLIVFRFAFWWVAMPPLFWCSRRDSSRAFSFRGFGAVFLVHRPMACQVFGRQSSLNHIAQTSARIAFFLTRSHSILAQLPFPAPLGPAFLALFLSVQIG